MLEPKLQPIEAAQSDVFLRVKNCPNFQKTNFCTYHERSNFGIKKSTFFFGVENFATILQISISFLPLFYKNLRRGGGVAQGGVSLRTKWIHLTQFFLICDFLRKYGQNALKLCRFGQNTMLIVKLTPTLVLPTNFSRQNLKAKIMII